MHRGPGNQSLDHLSINYARLPLLCIITGMSIAREAHVLNDYGNFDASGLGSRGAEPTLRGTCR